ncbi:MAG: cupin domain-containing protein [Bacteroidetes bacterium]|nr:cupin domain-containing protein [Bacteroidota bacterium]
MEHNATYWIEKLDLQKHPEGGYYKEIYRSDEVIPHSALPERFSGDRAYSTSIYFLLESKDFSAFHRIKSEEIWHFYKGSALNLYMISEDGILTTAILGDNIDNHETLQLIVPRNTWFAASVNKINDFTLVGCTVAPGFDFHDFELADCNQLTQIYPEHKTLIQQYCGSK